jgi:hypothetical protein
MTEITVPPALEVPAEVDDNEFSLSDLYDPRSKYSADQKIGAAMAYAETGNSKRASALCGIPNATIRWWKASAAWWPDAIAKCRKIRRDDLDGACSNIINKAMEQIENAVVNGETVVTKKGDVIQKPVSARDLTTMVAILFDKQSLMRGEATSRTERGDRTEVMRDLLTKFEELSEDIKKSTNLKVVSEQ